MAKLDVAYGSVRKLLTGDSQYVVPLYQRSYRWTTKKELPDLWEDVMMCYETQRNGDGNSPEAHFLGAVVTGQGGSPSPLGFTPFVIIDGQQRIISISLMIAALRDVLIPEDKSRRDVTRKYLAHVDDDDGAFEPRVLPSAQNRVTYMTVLRAEPLGRTRDAIADAYNFFRKSIERGLYRDSPTREELNPEANPADESITQGEKSSTPADPSETDELLQVDETSTQMAEPFDWPVLLDAMTQRLELVTISDVTPENAYNVFRTLNSTGLNLDQVDLLRNAFFMLLPTRAEKVHEELWTPMENRLGDAELGRFFHTNLIRLGENIPYEQTYRTQLKVLKRHGLGESSLMNQLETIEKDSRTYSAIGLVGDGPFYFGSTRLRDDVVAALRRLRTWGSYPAMPLVLDASARLSEGKTSQDELLEILTWIESILIRRYFVATAPNDLRSVFGRVMKGVQASSAQYMTALLGELEKPYVRWPANEELQRAVIEREFYRQKQKEEFFILRRLAEHLEGREYPHIALGNGPGQYSIEHILPQSDLTTAWTDELRSSDSKEDTFKTWQERKDVIGNLTLTAYNSQLGRKPFADKKHFIADHLRLKLSTAVLDMDHWTRTEIDHRSESLGKTAIELWARPQS